MFKFYLSTVIIWMIVIYCVVAIFQNGIAKKLRTNEEKKESLFKRLKVLFILAAVPIIRLLVIILLIYIAVCKQEDFDKLIEKSKDN